LVIGKFGREYEIDDYIFAALSIYIDIINIFSFILSLLGKTSNLNE
jgi:FtsH-binding integral membrane protein